jgi:hypothetical protein
MSAGDDPATLRSEEESFRDTMTAMMAEMRQHQDGLRGSAARYSCGRHGH